MRCKYCSGEHHYEQCPRISKIKYYKGGSVKSVHFKMSPLISTTTQPFDAKKYDNSVTISTGGTRRFDDMKITPAY